MTRSHDESKIMPPLSPEDNIALAMRAADLSDVPHEAIAAAMRRQQRAYERARRVVSGDLDPLSA